LLQHPSSPAAAAAADAAAGLDGLLLVAAVAAAAAEVVKQRLVLFVLLLHVSWLAARSGQGFCHPPMWWSTPCSEDQQYANFALTGDAMLVGYVIHAKTDVEQSMIRKLLTCWTKPEWS
jgi:hypothetical protein